MALQDVETELERLRVKAAAKVRRRCAISLWTATDPLDAQVREFLLQRFYGLRKPKTNIQVRCGAVVGALSACRSPSAHLEQILQQSVFLKFKYFVKFLQQHGQEVFAEVRTAYVETLSRIYRSALCASTGTDRLHPSIAPDTAPFSSQIRHCAQSAAS
jgi:hypothetical protein